jgi:predicted nucleotidyltransferase
MENPILSKSQPFCLNPALQLALKHMCQDWKIAQIALFGSVLRPDFRPDSDLDLLLEFHAGQEPSYFQWVQLQDTLERLFERKVDLVTRNGLLSSANTQRAEAILQSCQVLSFDG